LIFLTRRSATCSVDIPLVRATCSVSVPFCFSRSSHSESLVLPLDFRSLPPVSRASAPVFGVILVRPCRRTLFPSLPFDSFTGESVVCAVREFCPSSALFLPRLAVRQERRSGRVSPRPVACSLEFHHALGQQGAGRVGLQPLPLCPATVAA
jgi:hypothetical protein